MVTYAKDNKPSTETAVWNIIVGRWKIIRFRIRDGALMGFVDFLFAAST